jgi:hypothetical protein
MAAAIAPERHHKPGRRVTPALFLSILKPLDFDVKLYPYNNSAGAETFASVSV